MATFEDQLLIKFLDGGFVEDLLTNHLGLKTLFNVTYAAEQIDLKEATLAGVRRRQFQAPVFETIRVTGTRERIMPEAERVQLTRAQSRAGRLAWIEVWLEALVATKVETKTSPIERITTQDLITKLGGVASLDELRSKLQTLYPASVVAAFFNQTHIRTLKDFTQRSHLFVEFVYKAPPEFDPADPRNARAFSLNVCFKFQAELKLAETLREVKLCRSILERERDFAENFDGGEIITPYAFVVIFPEGVVTDTILPGLTAAEARARVKSLFEAEKILVHFLPGA
jgi:hypothetical protein